MMLMYDNHWIPVILNQSDRTMKYRSSGALPIQVSQELAKFMQCDAQNIVQIPSSDAYGWCGWGAIHWLLNEIDQPTPNANQIDGMSELQKFAELIGPMKFKDYTAKVQTKNQNHHEVWGVRLMFIKQMTAVPTQARWIGYGMEADQQNLRLTGRLAAIMIAHGHPDKESLAVARQLAQQCPKESKGIPSQKDSRAYSTLLQVCSEQGIDIKATGSNGAAQKLLSS